EPEHADALPFTHQRNEQDRLETQDFAEALETGIRVVGNVCDISNRTCLHGTTDMARTADRNRRLPEIIEAAAVDIGRATRDQPVAFAQIERADLALAQFGS